MTLLDVLSNRTCQTVSKVLYVCILLAGVIPLAFSAMKQNGWEFRLVVAPRFDCIVRLPVGYKPPGDGFHKRVIELDSSTYVVTYTSDDLRYEFWVEIRMGVAVPRLLFIGSDRYEYGAQLNGAWHPDKVTDYEAGFRKFLLGFKVYARAEGISEETLRVLDDTELQ